MTMTRRNRTRLDTSRQGDLAHAETVEHHRETATTLAAPMPSAPGAIVDLDSPVTGSADLTERYTVDRLLGRGGMGEVHACRDARIGREVALKMVRREVMDRPETRRRFLREVRVQGQLEHPAVVPVYDLGVGPDGSAFFTMKRVSGVTLADVLSGTAGGPDGYTENRLLGAFLQVCLCVDYAHARGVVHRDLKPENIMLGRFGEVYVLDWGIAKLAGDPRGPAVAGERLPLEADDGTHTPTRIGQVLGTPGYMAPEQIAAVDVDRRSDVYALGAILFELLTGARLHAGDSVAEVLASTRKGAEARASVRVPERAVAPELEAICVRATAGDPDERFATARALHDAVERFLEGDRDLEKRRAAAEQHAVVAAEAAERALGADDAGRARRTALSEVGRSLALDPSNDSARRTLRSLLTEPPRTTPPEALVEIRSTHAREERVAARIGAWSLAVAVLIASFAVIEVPVARIAPTFIPVLIAAVGCFYLAYGPRRWSWLPTLVVLFACLGLGFSTGFMGPLVVTPGLALALATLALNLGRGGRYRLFVVTGAALTVLLPAVLEMSDAIPSSYRNVDGGILITPRLFRVPERSYPVAVLVASVSTVVVAALFVWRLARANQALRSQLHVLKWQLGQLVPMEAAAEPRTREGAPGRLGE